MLVKARELAKRLGVDRRTVLRWRRLGFITGEKRFHGRRPFIEFDLEGVLKELERFKVLADDLAEALLKGKIRDQIEEAKVSGHKPATIRPPEPKPVKPTPKPERPLSAEEEVWGRKG